MKHGSTGFREINNPNNTNSTNNAKESSFATNRDKKSQSNKKRIIQTEEVEFPNIRSFQKELWNNIYSKESGDILQVLKKNNENIKSNRITIYENIGNISNNINNIMSETKNSIDKTLSDSQRNEYSDNEKKLNYINNNNNFHKLEKSTKSMRQVNNTNLITGEKMSEDDPVKTSNSNLNNRDLKNTININLHTDVENSMTNFQPELVAITSKRKKNQLKPDLNVALNNNKINFDQNYEALVKTHGSVSNRSIVSNTMINYNLNNKNNSINTNLNYVFNTNNQGAVNELHLDEKSEMMEISNKTGFPKIFKPKTKSKLLTLNNMNSTITLNNPNTNSTLIPTFERKASNNFSNHTHNNFSSTNFQQNTNYNNISPKIIGNKSTQNINNPNNSNSNIFMTNVANGNNMAMLNSSNHSNTLHSISKVMNQNSRKYFCPHCEHCNIIKDENLEKYFNMKEAKNIVKKSLDFIVTNYQTDQSYLDFLLGNNVPAHNYLNYINPESLQPMNKNNNLNINNAEYENLKILKNRTKFDIEVLLNTYPKHSNNRTVLQLVTHFLDALINDKVSLDSIAGPEIFEKLKESLISQGFAFKEIEGEIEFDKELDSIFDEGSKEKLRKLFKKIGSECKEKAVLLYRVFKLFFVEQEKKWTIITNHMKDKIHYYKELAKTVIQQKNKHLNKIEAINDCLFANQLSKKNLQDHKNLIKDLLNIINEKRDQIYLLKSDIEILTREVNFFVHDFDKLKLDENIREKLKEINVQKMVFNVNEEMSHKQVPESEKILLVNSDRFLILSGHRNYFYDQKNYYLNEVARVSELYENCKFKKKSYKRNLKDMQAQMDREMERLEKDIQYFREKLSCEKKDILIQTDVDNFEYSKILKNHHIIAYQKAMQYNKLTNFIEKIRFNCSRHKPISQKSVLNFIPEIYNEKMELDSRLDIEGKMKLTMDEFFVKFIKDKFKMTKIVKRNCEQMIMSIIKYSPLDARIDLLRKFLGIGEERIKREILDCYLTILKNLPISFYKIFEESDNNYLMTLENCMEIYKNKFPDFSLNSDSLEKLLRLCTVTHGENELDNLGLEDKKDIFYLMRYYNKQNVPFQLLLNGFKNNIKNQESSLIISDHIMVANDEYGLNLSQILDMLKRNFKIANENVQLDSFLDYFVDKHVFKIKVMDFMQVSIETFSIIYADLDKICQKMWENADSKKNGIIFFREFETVLNMLLGNSENKWKISDYFKSACQSPDKDFLNKDEFLSFCFNNKDILVILLSERKNNLPKTR